MHVLPYIGTTELEEMYRSVKGSEVGMRQFISAAKETASKTKNGALIYKDELALYKVFEEHLSLELSSLGIDCFGRLMQYIS